VRCTLATAGLARGIARGHLHASGGIFMLLRCFELVVRKSLVMNPGHPNPSLLTVHLRITTLLNIFLT